jgi:hypothetical protein
MDKKNNDGSTENDKSINKPDQETLHKTDPQDNMEGPISSMMQNIKDGAKDNNKETKEEADDKKDKNT